MAHAGLVTARHEMDRYADRLNEAAGMSDATDDAARMRAEDEEDDPEGT